jgi:nucleoside-diphosphate-sugar epimerase
VKTALVTGHRGFIGSYTAAALRDAGYAITGVDLADGVDVCHDLYKLRASYDLVVHCAAVVGGRMVMDRHPIAHAANLQSDAAMFRWAAERRPGRVVYFSSSCAYPVAVTSGRAWKLKENLLDLRYPMLADQLYGHAKMTGEMLAAELAADGVPTTVVRPFSVYGPGVREGFAVRGFAGQVRRKADPVEIWGDAGQVRDFVHVADVAAGVLAMAREAIDGPVNLATGRGTSLAELAAMMAGIAGYSPQVKVDTGLPAGLPSLVADASLLRSFCPPQVTLEDGLAEVLRG